MQLTRSEIDAAVDDPNWQAFRVSLKGYTTSEKLDKLYEYLGEAPTQVDRVRVDNYLNALLRGGQLRRCTNGMLIVHR